MKPGHPIIRRSLIAAVLGVGCNYYDFEAHRTSAADTDGLATETESESESEGAAVEGDPFFLPEEWAKIVLHGPLPSVAPSDPTNAYADDPAAAILGQRLYFETDYVENVDPNFNDCADCHGAEGWFGAVSLVTDDFRNVPPVVNSAFYLWYNWDGSRDSMWAQSLGPPEEQLGSTRLEVVHVVYDEYRDDYNAIFDPNLPPELDPSDPGAARFPAFGKPFLNVVDNPWDGMSASDQGVVNRIYVNFGKALAAYQRKLISGNSPFDRYVAGDFDAISEPAKNGLRLFIGEAGCAECHTGPAFTDNEFHNIGVPLAKESPNGRFGAIDRVLADEFNTRSIYSDADIGLLDGLSATESDKGKFRTKHLRQVAETGRWMHAGQYSSLRSVVEHYVDGGPTTSPIGVLDPEMRPRDVSASDIDDIVAFLETLTGDPIPDALSKNTSR